MSNQQELIEWGTQSLLSKALKVIHHPEIVVETPWSTVIRFSTPKGDFYLKQTPVDLYIEPEIVQAIQKIVVDSPTPIILFKSNELHCFLMKSCGEQSLRTFFKGTIDAQLLIKGLHAYIHILRSFEENLPVLEKIGVPDWRFKYIPQLYVELLANTELMIAEGLTALEIDNLKRLVPTIKSICEFLSKQTIKETLVNCDFNENNIILNENSQKLSIIDWGESVITHPFFSIASHLQSIARRYKLELNGPLLVKIKQQCLSCWLDVANMNDLEVIYQNILRLHPLLCSLALYRLQAATGNKSKEMQNWFVAGFLKALLKNESLGI